MKAGDKVVNELRDRGVLADEDETWGHLDALPVPQLECLLIVAVERLQRCLKSRWKLKRIEFLAFAAPFRWHVLANVLLSDSKLNATESPKLFATEKKSRDIIVLLLE